MVRSLARLGAPLALAPAASTGLYRLALLASAALPRQRLAWPAPRTRFTVVVPAHDEAIGLADTIAALHRQEYPTVLSRIVVVADNCTDATATVAADAGAEVMERDDLTQRGKGAALAWAIPQLLHSGDALVLIDADCHADPTLLRVFDAHLQSGARIVQADYRVANPEASPQAALRYAGFALQNTVRPAGRTRLGWSAGVSGTGIAFASDVLEAHPWRAFTFAEDREYHLQLVAGGERVEFARETSVTSAMPTTPGAARSQELRWDSGRGALLRSRAPVLLARGLRRRSLCAVDAALEPAIPPQSLWAALNLGGLALALVARRPRLVATAGFGLAAQTIFVVGGLLVAGTPATVWRALATETPGFATRRLGQLVEIARQRGPSAWVRTQRTP